MTKSTHGGKRQGAGRKTSPLKQQTYSFSCYPDQVDAIRLLIKNFKLNSHNGTQRK